MNQETFIRIIETGQPMPIAAELMNAARESAHRERSEALRAAVRWAGNRAKSSIALLWPNNRNQTSHILSKEIHT